MLSRVNSAGLRGVTAERVTVEADVSDGLPVMNMVGCLSSQVREARERVRTAIHNTGFRFEVKRITINLAPADIHKDATGYDLAIAIAILTSYGVIKALSTDGILFLGELGLGGELRGVRGALEIASRAKEFGCHTCILPEENLAEAAVIHDVQVLGAATLKQVVQFLGGRGKLETMDINIEELRSAESENLYKHDFADIKGQDLLRRAALVAVSGMHNLLIIGSPGIGKSMVASAIPSILPPMTEEEMLEVTRIYSAAGMMGGGRGLITARPFRSPHHTITQAALTGGGSIPRPGEISLAHKGVLFMDELTEFRSGVLETLRQPMEQGMITLNRKNMTCTFPADFMLVAAMNPCRCGYYPSAECRCTPWQVRDYLNHVSQPLLDRIDICVEAERLKYEEIASDEKCESSSQLREKVMRAVAVQRERYKGSGYLFNSALDEDGVARYCELSREEKRYMKGAWAAKKLTGRAYSRILKTARTIADLDGEERIRVEHLCEAIAYRSLDKKYWANGRYGNDKL